MYKVLIADDEVWVAALIRQSIDWEGLKLSPSGEAATGTDAYELIEKEKPDIVITDIRMPGLNGIALIEQCRLSGLNVEFIILSGYDDFKYAQLALKYNVVGFLLKPVDERELNSALGDAIKRIERCKSESDVHSRSAAQLNELRESFIMKLLNGGGRDNIPECLEDINRRYSFSFGDGYYICAVIRPEPAQESLSRAICQAAAKALDSTGVYQFCHVDGGNVVAVINAPFSILSPLPGLLYDLFSHVSETALAHGAEATMGVGSCETDFYSLGASYESAQEMLRHRLTGGRGKMYRAPGRAKPLNPHAQLSISKELRLSTLIETYNIAEFREFLNSLIDQFLSISSDPRGLFALLSQITSAYIKAVTRMGITERNVLVSREEMTARFEACDSIDDIKRCLDKHLCKPLEEYCAGHAADDSHLTAQAKMYVCEHYSENLRLIDVAEHLYRNPSYFGLVFKRDTGMSFSEYLNAYRVNIAKDLLLDFQYTVSAIAEMVGFNDFRQFSKAFKKLVGATPTEYRKNRRG